MLSDADGSAARKYGALSKGGRFARRTTFVIDPEGVIRHVDEAVDVVTHGADMADVLRELRGS